MTRRAAGSKWRSPIGSAADGHASRTSSPARPARRDVSMPAGRDRRGISSRAFPRQSEARSGHLTNRARSYGQAECAAGGVGRATSVVLPPGVVSRPRAEGVALGGPKYASVVVGWAASDARPVPCPSSLVARARGEDRRAYCGQSVRSDVPPSGGRRPGRAESTTARRRRTDGDARGGAGQASRRMPRRCRAGSWRRR